MAGAELFLAGKNPGPELSSVSSVPRPSSRLCSMLLAAQRGKRQARFVEINWKRMRDPGVDFPEIAPL